MEGPSNATPRKRILIVDPDRMVRVYLARLLLSRGYEVETMDNQWIFDRVSKFRPDLVLMDVNMGAFAIAALRERRFARETRFALYSELPADQLEILVRDTGAHGFLSKKSSRDEFLSGILCFLDLASEPATNGPWRWMTPPVSRPCREAARCN